MKNNRTLSRALIIVVLALPLAGSAIAQSQTVQAKGSVTVPGSSCNFALPNPDDWCQTGGSGARVSFSFQGEVLTPGSGTPVAAAGNFSAYFPETGYRIQGTVGTALIFPTQHFVFFNGECETRDALGQIVLFGTGPCSFSAFDQTPNGATDQVQVGAGSGTGFIQACCTVASGNVNVE